MSIESNPIFGGRFADGLSTATITEDGETIEVDGSFHDLYAVMERAIDSGATSSPASDLFNIIPTSHLMPVADWEG